MLSHLMNSIGMEAENAANFQDAPNPLLGGQTFVLVMVEENDVRLRVVINQHNHPLTFVSSMEVERSVNLKADARRLLVAGHSSVLQYVFFLILHFYYFTDI